MFLRTLASVIPCARRTHPFNTQTRPLHARRRTMQALALALLVSAAGIALAAPPPVSARYVGTLEVDIADDPVRGRSETTHYLRDETNGRRHELRFARGAAPDIAPGSRVAVRGRKDQGSLIVAAEDTEQLEAPSAAGATVQRTLVLIGDFTDASVSCTAAHVDGIMFSGSGYSVSDLYTEMTGGEVALDGQVAGPFAINYSRSSCDRYGWAAALDAKAQARGIDTGSYPRKVYVLPTENGCGFAGYGNIGGTNTKSWVFHCAAADLYAHELGHNFGLGHAGTPSSEYGDRSSIMGLSGFALRNSNAAHAESVGWLPSVGTSSVSAAGTYQLAPLYGSASGARTLVIPKPDTGENYYLSFRDGSGADATLPSSYKNRLTVHKHSGRASARTYLLGTYGDGQSFVDSANGITVTQLSHDANGARLSISMDSSCSNVRPAVTVSPASQTGTAEQSLTYQVRVANRDGAGCSAREFYLNARAPSSAWAVALVPDVVRLNPGAATTVTMTAVSAPTSSGDNVIAVDVSGAAPTTTATATYTVSGPAVPDTIAPSVPGGLEARARRRAISLTWRAATDNVGVAGYEILRDGVVIASTPEPVYSDRSADRSTPTVYRVRAFDRAGNRSALSNAITVAAESGRKGKKR